MPATESPKKEVTRSLQNIKNLFQETDEKTDDRYERYKQLINKIVKIPIEDIDLSDNVREKIDTDSPSFKSLVSSIKRNGIQQNIVVELKKEANGFKIICVSGHRRVTAAKMIDGMKVVPALIKNFDKKDSRIEIALAENLLREDLHCLDIADGYLRLFNMGWTKDKLGETFGKTQRTISTYLKMGSWSQEPKNIIRENPNLFTTRLLVHQIACRKFNTDSELISALQKVLNQKTAKPKSTNRKQKTKEKLEEYLKTQSYKKDIQLAILKTFQELNFI